MKEIKKASEINKISKNVPIDACANLIEKNAIKELKEIYVGDLTDSIINTLKENGYYTNEVVNTGKLKGNVISWESIIETITEFEQGDNKFEDVDKDYVVSGTIPAGTVSITGNSAKVNDITAESAVLKFNVQKSFSLSNSEITGTYDKKTMGNTIMSVHAEDEVVIKDTVITPEKAYNGIEIGLTTGLAKTITIDNVKFNGVFSNNTINIFGTQDNAVITIRNCHFEQVSNPIRISNRTNTRCTINIIDCTVNKWESGEYAGLMLCQDYTTNGEDNLFGDGKITINITNLTTPDGKLVKAEPETICGTKDDNQIIYVYANSKVIDYDKTKYPILNIA